ncbi:MAG: UDP-2,4-diacetamido-2,4,6-trideoxy-beta-L-altropyranose hydrolase [Phycisphaerales bacterium]|nr:UDP-2,4-diacetamido-2,4,6-trideoxy-beta-L-altropyranose hydrolase [Phycisphaerales bacterium]
MALREAVTIDRNIVIRCDGGPDIGMGHVVRCLALARALASRSIRARFAMRGPQGGAADRVRDAGFPVDAVGTASQCGAWLDDADCRATIEYAGAADAAVVLVDHYRADPEYLAKLADAGLRVALIDDVADRDLIAADWILNQNPAGLSLKYRVRDDCTVLRGPEYALLRPEFADARASLHRECHDDAWRVLITLGGSDVAARLAAIVEALEPARRTLDVRCVLAGSADNAVLVQAAGDSRHRVQVLTDVADMAAQMAWADVAVTAGGSTCWELCCLGVPMVVTELSGDQTYNTAFLGERGIAVNVGRWDGAATPTSAAEAVGALLGDATKRSAMSERGAALVDGRGADRVADSLGVLVHARGEVVL